MSRVSLSDLADRVEVPTLATRPTKPQKATTAEVPTTRKPVTADDGGVIPARQAAAPEAAAATPRSQPAPRRPNSEADAAAGDAPQTETPEPSAAESASQRADRPGRARPPAGSNNITAAPSHMPWHEYERKETRLREDQYGALTAASRRLNKQRKGRGERITENTLIRVAIDLLLNEEKKLAGVTETELRQSVGL